MIKIIIDIITYWSTKPSNSWWQKVPMKSTYSRGRCKWCESKCFWTSDCLKYDKITLQLAISYKNNNNNQPTKKNKKIKNHIDDALK